MAALDLNVAIACIRICHFEFDGLERKSPLLPSFGNPSSSELSLPTGKEGEDGGCLWSLKKTAGCYLLEMLRPLPGRLVIAGISARIKGALSMHCRTRCFELPILHGLLSTVRALGIIDLHISAILLLSSVCYDDGDGWPKGHRCLLAAGGAMEGRRI
ncbi:hypothetical protein ACLOJK_004627 [Asimina triloba]